MTSTNTDPHAVAYSWHAWVTVPGQGRAFASGTVTGPHGYCRARALRDIGAWLGANGCKGRLADIALLPA
ncbi:hypothetical protein [Streptomyces sp. WAC00263]|uniref:hypothetical protein n=1 Tax=Streptomyces sp. WAC00263 TaxID=1917422 RepID=UPI0015EEA39E|nr:hypothetical protein [Streptomyces sp. WAC00263]KAF5995815.1 hypothetical protein BOG92_032345 [Streptomyces sp. WAC00263]